MSEDPAIELVNTATNVSFLCSQFAFDQGRLVVGVYWPSL